MIDTRGAFTPFFGLLLSQTDEDIEDAASCERSSCYRGITGNYINDSHGDTGERSRAADTGRHRFDAARRFLDDRHGRRGQMVAGHLFTEPARVSALRRFDAGNRPICSH